MYYVYKFINYENEIIYCGRTNNIDRRMTKEHFTKTGHLPEECYSQVKEIWYAKLESKAMMKIYEMYYINKWQPYYNQKDKYDKCNLVNLPELEWTRYKTDEEYYIENTEKLKEIYNLNYLNIGDICKITELNKDDVKTYMSNRGININDRIHKRNIYLLYDYSDNLIGGFSRKNKLIDYLKHKMEEHYSKINDTYSIALQKKFICFSENECNLARRTKENAWYYGYYIKPCDSLEYYYTYKQIIA